MHILVTNDDGVQAPGILALAQAMRQVGQVTVFAPDRNWSASGHVKTMHRPLRARPMQLADGTPALASDGAPSDCVALGAFEWKEAEIVLSGINLGSNLGNSMWPSGTVAAARQAALMGLRGIALSTPAGGEEAYLAGLEPWVRRVLEFLFPLADVPLVNVNFPAKPPLGIRWTRQSVRHYDGRIVPGEDPMGRKHFWFTVAPVENVDADTDRWAVEHGFISLTPVRLDLTDERALDSLRATHPAEAAAKGAVEPAEERAAVGPGNSQ